MKIESPLNLRWSYRSLMAVVFLVISSSLFSQQLRIAQTFEDNCSPFYNGVATIGDDYDDCYYIDRLGNNLGKAPGQLIFATKNNRVFKSYNREDLNEMFITDLNDNIISRRYRKIKEFGGYFFCEIDCSAREPKKIDILNFNLNFKLICND